MKKKNILYAQSGGVTSVINATACGVISSALKNKDKINKILAGRNGIIGILKEELCNINLENIDDINNLKYTPGGAFGSCRYKLRSKRDLERLFKIFKTHNVGYFMYNGGGDSQDTTNKIHEYAKSNNYDLKCIGIPKTIDNDLPHTDFCPGFGSVAKYTAIATLEASMDIKSMCASSTKVFIYEVMGRHTGWIAASSKLSKITALIILLPEVPLDLHALFKEIKQKILKFGYCSIVVSEGVKDQNNKFLVDSDNVDSFGHLQLGGVAPKLASIIKEKIKVKVHWAVSDYLQRSARHISSKVDVTQAYKLGQKSISLALNNVSGVMLTLNRKILHNKISWKIQHTPLDKVANIEKTLPSQFISSNGMNVTHRCEEYLLPLINGESYPKYHQGLPTYTTLKNKILTKKLPYYRLK